MKKQWTLWLSLFVLSLFGPFGISQGCQSVDADGDGYNAEVDCNDNDASIHPDQEEPCTCDGIDQNCNGIVDDFPCDMVCTLNQGDLCDPSSSQCGAGLTCCYPCGIQGCDFVCAPTCDPSEPACSNGCYLYP